MPTRLSTLTWQIEPLSIFAMDDETLTLEVQKHDIIYDAKLILEELREEGKVIQSFGC